MTESPIICTLDGAVGRIVLNRPEAMNAITVDLAEQLEAGLRSLAERARVIVIRGAGGNFCAGGDFNELRRLRAQGPAALVGLFAAFGAACDAIAELPVPVVAAVEGYAMAGGFELIQAVDVAIVRDDATLADTHLDHGQIPGGGGSQRLPRIVGRQRALGHILTGERLSGAEAVAWGLAYRSAPAATFEAAVEELVGRLATRDPEALARAKRLVRDGLERPLADGLALERTAVVEHVGGAAAGAGIAAFTGKRS